MRSLHMVIMTMLLGLTAQATTKSARTPVNEAPAPAVVSDAESKLAKLKSQFQFAATDDEKDAIRAKIKALHKDYPELDGSRSPASTAALSGPAN